MNKSSKEDFTKNKKELGQNWLIDERAVNLFINFCSINPTDNVLEIGVGKLALTLPLLDRANKVVAIEIDPQLVQQAKLQIKNYKLKILEEDFLQSDLEKLVKEEKITKIVSAIPYNITSPIIHKIVRELTNPLSEVFLITQKEFAIKAIGKKNKRSYFTNLLERYFTLFKGQVIQKTSFYPIPKVDSMYFGLKVKTIPKSITDVLEWEKFLHHVFKNPRKKLNKAFGAQTLKNCGIDPNQRAENLSIKNLITLQQYLEKKI